MSPKKKAALIGEQSIAYFTTYSLYVQVVVANLIFLFLIASNYRQINYATNHIIRNIAFDKLITNQV